VFAVADRLLAIPTTPTPFLHMQRLFFACIWIRYHAQFSLNLPLFSWLLVSLVSIRLCSAQLPAASRLLLLILHRPLWAAYCVLIGIVAARTLKARVGSTCACAVAVSVSAYAPLESQSSLQTTDTFLPSPCHPTTWDWLFVSFPCPYHLPPARLQ